MMHIYMQRCGHHLYVAYYEVHTLYISYIYMIIVVCCTLMTLFKHLSHWLDYRRN